MFENGSQHLDLTTREEKVFSICSKGAPEDLSYDILLPRYFAVSNTCSFVKSKLSGCTLDRAIVQWAY